MEDSPYSLMCDIRALNKVFRRACSQVILLNHQIEAAKARYDRARAVKRLSFRYSNRLKLTSLEGVRNLIYEYACQKCEEIENLQGKLRNLSDNDFEYSDTDASGNEEDAEDEDANADEPNPTESRNEPTEPDHEAADTETVVQPPMQRLFGGQSTSIDTSK